MTLDQQKGIEHAWAKKRVTQQGIQRAKDILTNAGLARISDDRMKELDWALQTAIDADNTAIDEVEASMRSAGLNV